MGRAPGRWTGGCRLGATAEHRALLTIGGPDRILAPRDKFTALIKGRDSKGIGCETRAAPATVSGSPHVKNHWLSFRERRREGDARTSATSQETCLPLSSIDRPGCVERAAFLQRRP